MRLIILKNFYGTSCGYYSFFGFCAGRVHLESYFRFHLSASKDLYKISAVDESVNVKEIRSEFSEAVFLDEEVNLTDVKYFVVNAERIDETAFRHTTLDRHLATLVASF